MLNDFSYQHKYINLRYKLKYICVFKMKEKDEKFRVECKFNINNYLRTFAISPRSTASKYFFSSNVRGVGKLGILNRIFGDTGSMLISTCRKYKKNKLKLNC